MCVFFFFQAEDGIRDVAVTGVQTCALPIFRFRGEANVRSPAGAGLLWHATSQQSHGSSDRVKSPLSRRPRGSLPHGQTVWKLRVSDDADIGPGGSWFGLEAPSRCRGI